MSPNTLPPRFRERKLPSFRSTYEFSFQYFLLVFKVGRSQYIGVSTGIHIQEDTAIGI